MSLSEPVLAGIGDSTSVPIHLIANSDDSTPVSSCIIDDSDDSTPVPSCAIDNSEDDTTSVPRGSSPIVAPRLPLELLMCICDFLPNRKDIVNLSATCQELRGALYYTLVHRDLRTGRLITLKYGLQTRNMRVIEPFFDRYRHLITRLTVTPKEKEVKPTKKVTDGKKVTTTTKKVTPKKVDDKNNVKAGTSNQITLPVRTRQPPPPTTIISFRDEHLPSLRLIRPLLTSALEKALLAHDLTFAEHLLWHGNKDLIPSLTPVLESVLWTAFNFNTCPRTVKALDHPDRPARTCADPGPVTPIVWTWKTCPLAAVKLLVKFGAKGNRAGIWAEGKKTRKRRREWFGGNGGSVIDNVYSVNPHPEEDETTETPDVYDGYYHSKTETSAAHVHKPAMPPGRLWTGLERVAFFYVEACESAAAAAAEAAASAAAVAATAGSADSGADVGPAADSAGAAPVAKSKGIKRNLSGSFRNPGSGSEPSPGTGKEHRFFPVQCERHDEKGKGSCFKQLIEVLSESITHDEISLSSKGRARAPKAPFLEHDLDNMLKLAEITVPFVKMPIDEQAKKLFQEIFEEAGDRRFEVLDRFMEKRQSLDKNKKMKTENMTRTVLEDKDEEEDFWAEQGELDLDEEEPDEDEDDEE